MHSNLTKDEIMQWRRSTEKITLEEFASRLGKSVDSKKETNDLHDLLLKRGDSHEEDIQKTKNSVTKPEREPIGKIAEKSVEAVQKTQKEPEETKQKPNLEIKISFKKKLNKREAIVFNYFCRNRKQKVSVNDLANLLDLPNDYVYKYIKNLRSKLSGDVLVNADKGGYILNI